MSINKNASRKKSKLHPRSLHRQSYDFKQLIATCPALAPFVHRNKYQNESIDFFNPAAVKMLNKALLLHHYELTYWDIPKTYLCPPIPGRADYIHYAADVLASGNGGKIPTGASINCLDIGVGANCVYPIIGHQSYGWSFVGADIDPVALQSANQIVAKNTFLKKNINLRLQKQAKNTFQGILQKKEYFDLSICNPPFHASLKEAQTGTRRKLTNLKAPKTAQPILNFGGQNNELWCKGGEKRFIHDMIVESASFATSCYWFSTLVSKQIHLKDIYTTLKKVKTTEIKTIPMAQGNKISRIIAWTFLSPKQQKVWRAVRWKK